jgi:hypothetical protein
MKVPFLWAQLIAGHLSYSGPQSRTPLRSSSLCRARKEAVATLPPNGTARGPRLPPLQSQHGRTTLQPRQGFSCRWQSHGWKLTTPLSNIVLTAKDKRCKPVLDIPPPSLERHHDEVALLASRPLPWLSQMRHLGVSLHLRRRGS